MIQTSGSPRGDLLRHEGGAVQVEYVVLLSLVTLGAALAVAALGVPLLSLHHYMQTLLLVPIP
ncbi:MAG: hypothetical protein ACOCXM_04520 [Myxococcota bacterium]